MKRTNLAFAARLAGVFLLAVCSADGFAAPQSYDGVATPIVSTTIRFGYNGAFRGFISRVARPGAILRGPVLDMNNRVVEPGDILVQMKTDYWQSQVKEKLASLKSAEATLKNTQASYLRYKALSGKNATSEEAFQQAEADYFAAIGAKEAAESDIELARVMLECCTFQTPFDAVVDQVYFPSGLCAGELDIVRISQLSPMGIKVKMDRSTALGVTMETPISVFPCNSGEPVGVFHCASYLLPDGIMILVDNVPLPTPADPDQNGKSIPLCRASVVMTYQFSGGDRKSRMMVPMDSIGKDDQGYFVWRGIGQRENQIKGVSPVFPVEKVRIIPDDLKTELNASIQFRMLKDPGSLKEADIVLLNPPAGLKDKQQVCVQPPRYRFMPGDPVEVRIGE